MAYSDLTQEPAPSGVAPATGARASVGDLYRAWLGQRARLLPWTSDHAFLHFVMACWLLVTLAALYRVLKGLALSALSALLPAWREFLGQYSQIDCSLELGIVAKPPLYYSMYFWLSCGIMAILVGSYVGCWRIQEGRSRRSFAIVATVLWVVILFAVKGRVASGHAVLSGVESGGIFDLQWQKLERLKIVECNSTQHRMAEVRADLRKRPLTTFADLHHAAMEHYARLLPTLETRWTNVGPMTDEKRKTLFIMNLVSGMWSFGNRYDVGNTGCVFCNENNHAAPPAPSLRAYLDAKIGCCSDHANLTKSLLDHAGIENRLTANPGHIFNEVRIDGRWCVVDTSANLFIDASWEELFDTHEPLKRVAVFVFPHPNSLDADPENYRPLSGLFRLVTILRVADQPAYLREVTHPPLPSYFD